MDEPLFVSSHLTNNQSPHPGDSDDGQYVSFTEGQVLVIGRLEVVFGYTLCARWPRCLCSPGQREQSVNDRDNLGDSKKKMAEQRLWIEVDPESWGRVFKKKRELKKTPMSDVEITYELLLFVVYILYVLFTLL